MNVQTLILGILNFDDASGYEIKKQSTEGVFRFFVDISYGSIYPTLSKLEADGFVTCRAESQDGKPDKKVYSITDKGRAEFVGMLQQPPAFDKFKSEFLLLAMCADLTPKSTICKAIDERISEMEELLAHIQDLQTECDHPATQWISNYGIHVKTADLEFLRKNRDTLQSIALPDTSMAEAAE